MDKKLESFLDVIPELKSILQEDIAVDLTDTTNIIYYDGGGIVDLPIKIGDEIGTDDPMYRVIQEGKIENIIVSKINKTISRIFRDTRFSKDKSLYKNTMCLTFKRAKKEWRDAPAFFFEISPQSYGIL